MPTPAVVEQQAKLGVSAEESKAQRLKRQQARFRDRGGAFVPSSSNPLVDILLARTVSGESPTKTCPKDVSAKRLSLSKARQASPPHKVGMATITQQSRAVAGNSKSKPPASGKRKAKAVEPEADPTAKPLKRRGTGKGKKKTPGPDSDAEQPLPANTKSKSAPKGKGKRAIPSSSDENPKSKPKSKAKVKSNPAKAVVEVLASDDDQTLVEVPHKAKSNPKTDMRYEDDAADDDAPIVRRRATSRVENSKAVGTEVPMHVKTERIGDTTSSRKKTSKGGGERVPDEKHPKVTVKRPASRDEENLAVPSSKKRKAVNVASAKLKTTTEPEPALGPTGAVEKREDPKASGKGKINARAQSPQDVVEPMEGDGDERPFDHISKPKKRKKEEDNYDDRPQKVVKFSDAGLPHPSSQKLKENQSERKRERATRSNVKDEPGAPREKLATKRPSRAKTAKGLPREVLERIKASAARHFRCADGEPDELDCLS